jgi:VCBS repeat-containing protein
MNPAISVSSRRMLTARDLAVVATVWGRSLGAPVQEHLLVAPAPIGNSYSAVNYPSLSYAIPAQQTIVAGAWGFSPLTVPVWSANSGQTGAVINGSFMQSNPTAGDFGWALRGVVEVDAGEATLSESILGQARLYQNVTFPAGALRLEITFNQFEFSANRYNPGDAFEVALIAANFAGIEGMADSDSLFNLQSDGTARWAESVSIEGLSSGSVLDGNTAYKLVLDVASLPAGSVVGISIDLIGFGGLASFVVVEDVSVYENRLPTAQDANASVVEGQYVDGVVSATDPESHPLTYSLDTNPLYGTVVFEADGTYRYTAHRQPTDGFIATDTFTFVANDGFGDSNPATVTITITAINDAPVAIADTFTVAEGATHSGSVSATDVDGDALTYALTADAAYGTLTFNTDGTFSYVAHRQPTVGFVITDSFTFVANDGLVDSAVATVTITLTPVNDAPVVSDGSFTLAEGATYNGNVSASDPDGDVLVFLLVSGPNYGTLILNTDGSFIYTAHRQPTIGFVGADSFTFKANDGTVDSNTSTVTITLTPINDAPLAADHAITVTEGQSHSGVVTASDVDGDPMTFLLMTAPAHGSVVLNPDGTFIYSADIQGTAAFVASDAFTFIANDGSADSVPATVHITIHPVAGGGYDLSEKWLDVTTAGDKARGDQPATEDEEEQEDPLVDDATRANNVTHQAHYSQSGSGSYSKQPLLLKAVMIELPESSSAPLSASYVFDATSNSFRLSVGLASMPPAELLTAAAMYVFVDEGWVEMELPIQIQMVDGELQIVFENPLPEGDYQIGFGEGVWTLVWSIENE